MAATPICVPNCASKTCTLTPKAVEGPLYFDPKLGRSDITEARPGAPLHLTLQVVEADSCLLGKNARVDLWHADALRYPHAQ